MNKTAPRILIWYRQDLRILDHEPLFTANQQQAIAIPFYCFDDRHFAKTSFGFAKTGRFRAQFLIESVTDLRRSLQSLGTDLLVRQGLPEQIIVAIATELKIDAIYFYQEVTSAEIAVEKRLAQAFEHSNLKIQPFWGHTLYHPEDLPFDPEDTPELFTNFRKQLEQNSTIRLAKTAPKQLTDWRSLIHNPDHLSGQFLDQENDHIYIGEKYAGEIPNSAALLINSSIDLNIDSDLELDLSPPKICLQAGLEFSGGETAAQNRLQAYFWEGDHLRNYKQTRNGMLGTDYSSKFSAWLAQGCISPNTIVQEVRRYEEQRIANDSTYWLIFELLWRDYFRYIALKHGDRIFRSSGLQGLAIAWKQDWQRFRLWQEGKTGFPLIDANMKELSASGFMSNRGRQNVASFLTKNLGIDWRMGAEWFESLLIDYDVCSNWGNWNYAAGVGNDARGFRFFNILKQSHDYDPEGKYVKYWLPALKNLPPTKVHEPTKLLAVEQQRFEITLGVDYPHQIVDLFKSAKANEKIYEAAIATNQPPNNSKFTAKNKLR
jgi:deoxyribodipyrimidine photo-lyase